MIRFPRERMAIATRGAAAAAAAATSRSSSLSSRNNIAATAARFLSSTSAAAAAAADDNINNPLSRYGLGGHHWKQFDPNSYQSLISEALSRKVNYLEIAGQDGGDIAMVGAIQSIMERSPHLILDAKQPITITTRIGYRTLIPQSEQQQQTTTPDEKAPPPQPPLLLPGDVILTEQQMDDEEEGMLAATSANNKASQKVVHNLSADYIRNAVEKTSPLLELFNEEEFQKHFKLVYLIHNPEVQVLEFLKVNPNATMIDRQSYIQQSWQPALDTLQEYCLTAAATKNNNISFGVVSNGLGIPPELDHPMHLSSDIIVDACTQNDQFTTIQLPANLLEGHGIHTAKILRKALLLPQQQQVVDIVAMRPLTCYPDLGTGNSHPFRLVDYELPSTGNENGDSEGSSGKTTQFTHEMTGIPSLYHIALQTTVSHFDAEELLETKLERDLTMEERETLDGCKLVQSMIHDLDSDLDSIRSFAAHEEELYGRIIPLLYDTFEAMDDRTSDVLQAYFAAYALAVRYAIAKKTRQILKHGEDGTNISNGSGGGGGDNNNNKTSITSSLSTKLYPDIPDSMALQEYALRQMLAASVSVGSDDNGDDDNDSNQPREEEAKAFSRIVIGASTLEDFRRQIDLMEYLLKDISPLDAIDSANNNKVKEKEE